MVVLKKSDYVQKVDIMITDRIRDGKYKVANDNTHKDLSNFQSFLYRHFKNNKYYNDMRPQSNQPARFFESAKTHKFNNIDDITVEDLKLKPIID